MGTRSGASRRSGIRNRSSPGSSIGTGMISAAFSCRRINDGSRGLAWALYGFGTVYGYTRDSRFLSTAECCADFYIAHTPPAGVPPWDYDAPEESRKQVDTSAAAIAASGLFQLAGLVSQSVK